MESIGKEMEKLELLAVKKHYMGGKLYLLHVPIDLEIIETVSVYRNTNWFIVTLPKKTQLYIEQKVKEVASFHKTPYNEDGKLFIPAKKLISLSIWKENKEIGCENDLSMGRSAVRVKLEVDKFTHYKNNLSFKLIVNDILLLSTQQSCPF